MFLHFKHHFSLKQINTFTLAYRNGYIIYLRTIRAAFLDEGPTATALVMVVNGLRVTTEYVYKSVCFCVCVRAQSAVVTPGSPTTSIWSVVINGGVSLSLSPGSG